MSESTALPLKAAPEIIERRKAARFYLPQPPSPPPPTSSSTLPNEQQDCITAKPRLRLTLTSFSPWNEPRLPVGSFPPSLLLSILLSSSSLPGSDTFLFPSAAPTCWATTCRKSGHRGSLFTGFVRRLTLRFTRNARSPQQLTAINVSSSK